MSRSASWGGGRVPDGSGEAAALSVGAPATPAIPDYLEQYYWWAYLRPASLRVFDHPAVVSAILWGQYRRLSDAVLAEIAPGANVLQLACVYGDLTLRLAARLGPDSQ